MRFLPRGLAFGASAAGLVASAAIAPACGSDSSCEETRSCEAPKEGGAGDSGADAPQACEKNEDCENGLVCDGVATCVESLCVPGVPVDCTALAAAHCTAACKEGSGKCELSPSDVDGDQHLDPLCTAATVTPTLPVDDCDDANEKVYPGATEICDGVDNDCDDKMDFQGEGLSLSGASEDFVTTSALGHPAIAWSSTAQKYGVVWEDDRFFLDGGDEEVMFALMNPDGTKSGSDRRISDAVNESTYPRVAAGNGSFGIVWGDNRNGEPDIYFRRLDGTGVPQTPEVRLTMDSGASDVADIVSIPDGWIVLFQDSAPANKIYGMRLDLDGAVLKPKTLIGTKTGKTAVPRIAVADGHVGVLWSNLGSATSMFSVSFLRTDFDLVVTEPELQVSDNVPNNTGGQMGDIVSNGIDDGFTIAYFNYQRPDNVVYAELSKSGLPNHCATSNGSTITPGAVGEVVKYPGGSAFIHTIGVGSSTAVHIGLFDDDCGHFVDLNVDTTNTAEVNPFIASAASGEAGIAFVWENVQTQTIRRRVTGPHLCD